MRLQANTPHAVVWDPSGRLPEGTILQGQQAEVAASEGAVLLPCNLDQLRRSACGGYVKRCYGSGWRYHALNNDRGGSLLLYVAPALGDVQWAARLVPEPGRAEGEPLQGQLRVAVDTAQPGCAPVGLIPTSGPLDLGKLGPPDAHGGWTWRGSSGLTAPGDCFVGLMVYGAAAGVRVLWFAASQG